ncbi:hypothetical protein HanHA300_Chr02g0044891 [Helianthus annuus]|nr:hypothetical protein HanHA300_Chr02g0044891 [Helianthus annuus]KAJ0618024.1 hypothetical protein HanHA89_Chr02g0048481 [Helianthus annuus]KAJ0950915.1 hypothetical protein HanPSC8_Chr02g0053881 [Helianthus annuus]
MTKYIYTQPHSLTALLTATLDASLTLSVVISHHHNPHTSRVRHSLNITQTITFLRLIRNLCPNQRHLVAIVGDPKQLANHRSWRPHRNRSLDRVSFPFILKPCSAELDSLFCSDNHPVRISWILHFYSCTILQEFATQSMLKVQDSRIKLG